MPTPKELFEGLKLGASDLSRRANAALPPAAKAVEDNVITPVKKGAKHLKDKFVADIRADDSAPPLIKRMVK